MPILSKGVFRTLEHIFYLSNNYEIRSHIDIKLKNIPLIYYYLFSFNSDVFVILDNSSVPVSNDSDSPDSEVAGAPASSPGQEDIPSFREWTQKQLAEAEKKKGEVFVSYTRRQGK